MLEFVSAVATGPYHLTIQLSEPVSLMADTDYGFEVSFNGGASWNATLIDLSQGYAYFDVRFSSQTVEAGMMFSDVLSLRFTPNPSFPVERPGESEVRLLGFSSAPVANEIPPLVIAVGEPRTADQNTLAGSIAAIAASGGRPPYVFALESGLEDSGWSMTANGSFSGGYAKKYSGAPEFSVIDSSRVAQADSASVAWNQETDPPLAVIDLNVGGPYIVGVPVMGLTFGLQGVLPSVVGVSGLPSGTYRDDLSIQGTPDTAGTYNPVITIVDSYGDQATQPFVMIIEDPV